MSIWFKLTISEQLAARIEAKRGLLSLQEFTIQALVAACEGSLVELELRCEIERLHVTLRCFGRQPSAELPAPQAGTSDDQRLGW
jgi:hypothetical protein